jgi:FMN phosphatase YigB (HAD superfamily)
MIRAIIFDFFRTLYDVDLQCVPEETVVLLRELKSRYLLALVSRGGEERRQQVRQISSLFDAVIVGEEKTQEDFRRICIRFQLKPDEILVVGDRVQSEILLGKIAGMKTCWYRQGKFADELPATESEHPDFIICSLSELKGNTFFKQGSGKYKS